MLNLEKSALKSKSKTTKVTTINCTPTWEWAMSVYIRAIAQDGYDAKLAVDELMNLARYCDKLNKEKNQA